MPASRSPFGARLERELMSSGATQHQFAEQLGVSQQTISKWITGETTPRLRHLPRIEELLGTPPGTLSSLLFAPHTAPSPAEPLASAGVSLAGLRRKLRLLTPDELALVEVYIEGLHQQRR